MSNFLSRMCENSGLSRESLAEKVGVTELTLWAWEMGVETPTLDEVSMLAEILEIDFKMLARELGYPLAQISYFVPSKTFHTR